MTLSFNVTGPERKRLVQTIEKATGKKTEYLGAPGFAYRIGEYEVSRYGELTFPDSLSIEESSIVIDDCVMAGFEPEEWEQNHEDEVSVSIPEETMTEEETEKLMNLIASKETLLKKALGRDSLEVIRREGKVTFPWISGTDAEEVSAVTKLISAMCETAKKQKRVNAKEKAVENEKYAFRCFLLRLGFIGDEYKADRKTLLKNFSGSSAFKAKKEA